MAKRVNVALARVSAYLRADLERHRISQRVGEARIFATLHEAIDWIRSDGSRKRQACGTCTPRPAVLQDEEQGQGSTKLTSVPERRVLRPDKISSCRSDLPFIDQSTSSSVPRIYPGRSYMSATPTLGCGSYSCTMASVRGEALALDYGVNAIGLHRTCASGRNEYRRKTT
jgi:hypothetical protein